MRKRSAAQSPSSTILQPVNKRSRSLHPPEPPRPDPVPLWLHDAATAFVASTPHLSWTGGFYSWGTWLDHLRQLHLWTSVSHPSSTTPWRALIDACRASHQVHGTAALYRAKSDLVSIIINLVYRRGEHQRVSNPEQNPASERDVMRRIRAVVTRQRRHESVSLTLIRFLDFAFVFTAYKDCRIALNADRQSKNVSNVSEQVESELFFFNNRPTAKDIREETLRMQSFMWKQRWLPWYEQVPGVRDEMVIRAREAALAFCDGLPYPELRIGVGVRGLSRDHLAGASSMNEWLLNLFEPSYRMKWANLSAVYERAVSERRGEEDPLLEETSRRVVETVLAPLTEATEGLDPTHSKLIDATPGIVVTQSLSIPGRFTFRQLLELHINLVVYAKYLHSTLYDCKLPSIEQIHSGVVLFEDIRSRILDVRLLIDSKHADALFNWCLFATEPHSTDTHLTAAACDGCESYQRTAIKAASRSAILSFARNPKNPLPKSNVSDSDPLAYAAIIAEWDPFLAARIIDAAVRINRDVREKFLAGNGNGLDLYTHRRVLVCDAARETFRGDVKAAARIMARLHPVWDVCERDKGVGSFDERGALSLKFSVDRGNFEAAAAFGVLLCSEDWEERRRACNIQRDIEGGLVYMCKAISMGDTSAAGDLVHLLEVAKGKRNSGRWEIPQRVADYVLDCLHVSSQEEPSMGLFLGFIYSLGAPGIPANCDSAMKAYEKVIQFSTSPTYQAYAANNIGAMLALNSGIETRKVGKEDESSKYLRAAALAGNRKAESNLAALLVQEKKEYEQTVKEASELYRRIFNNSKGSQGVTVIQSDRASKEMNVYEVIISKERQTAFQADLKAEGMSVEQYGRIVQQETLQGI